MRFVASHAREGSEHRPGDMSERAICSTDGPAAAATVLLRRDRDSELIGPVLGERRQANTDHISGVAARSSSRTSLASAREHSRGSGLCRNLGEHQPDR